MVTLITWEALWYFDLKCFVWSFWIPKKKSRRGGWPRGNDQRWGGPMGLGNGDCWTNPGRVFFFNDFSHGWFASSKWSNLVNMLHLFPPYAIWTFFWGKVFLKEDQLKGRVPRPRRHVVQVDDCGSSGGRLSKWLAHGWEKFYYKKWIEMVFFPTIWELFLLLIKFSWLILAKTNAPKNSFL